MDTAERLEVASKFLLQSPPGEVNDVLNDIRDIISDDDGLKGVLPSLREYNLAQFITVDVPGTNHQSIISEAARVQHTSGALKDSERFLDPRSHTTFTFDHLIMEATDPVKVQPELALEPFRLSLENSTLTYLASHFYSGVACVFNMQGNSENFVIQIVANKYNPTNYWSGRWRSEYVVDLAQFEVRGKIMTNVHYYEQGNVQLSTVHDIRFKLPPGIVISSPTPSASKILALISQYEGEYQRSLNNSYREMGEKTFKSLRRALPMTRQKLDWDKVLGYKIGAELSQSRSVFDNS